MSISSRLIECWCFGLPAALGVGAGCMAWGGVWGGGWVYGHWGWFGVVGGAPTHVHMHAYAGTCTHAHTCVVNMIISCKWLPTLGNPWEFPTMSYTCTHACPCVHACVCVWEYPLTTPHQHSPTPHLPGGNHWNQSKFNSTWTNRDISILFEDLKSVETSPPMGGCMVWWSGGWLDE